MINTRKNGLSIYVHYPFCKSKCPYCDFNSHEREKIDFEAFEKAYLKEIEFFYQKIGRKRVKTIFFGGGTPSLMKISLVKAILDKIYQLFEVDEDCEISLEANPTSYEAQKFLELKKVGINRISLGVQSFNDKDLKFLGRNHSSSEAIETIQELNRVFDNFSFDLIYARPDQKIEDWEKELELALSFQTKHLSLYQLIIEKGTQFYSDFNKNKFKMLDDEISAHFYEKTNEIMDEKGFENYEISNYALMGFRSRHNLAYWQSQDYIGIGAGAHSRVYFQDEEERKSIMMIHNPEKWCESVFEKNHGIQKIENLDLRELCEEIILMGLRLKDGIENSVFYDHIGCDFEKIINFESLNGLFDSGFLSYNGKILKIEEKGKILTNSIISKVVDGIQI